MNQTNQLTLKQMLTDNNNRKHRENTLRIIYQIINTQIVTKTLSPLPPSARASECSNIRTRSNQRRNHGKFRAHYLKERPPRTPTLPTLARGAHTARTWQRAPAKIECPQAHCAQRPYCAAAYMPQLCSSGLRQCCLQCARAPKLIFPIYCTFGNIIIIKFGI